MDYINMKNVQIHHLKKGLEVLEQKGKKNNKLQL